MRSTYIILAHQLPEQLVRLVDRLDRPDARFLIHLDLNMPGDEVAVVETALRDLPNVEFLKRHRCAWAAFSIVEATMEGLRRCVTQPFDYCVLLSGQDYPIKSNREIAAFLQSLDGGSVIHHLPFPMIHWSHGGWYRIRKFHAIGHPRPVRAAARLANMVPVDRRYPRGLHPYGGAQFWALSQSAVEHVLAFVAENRRFVRYYRSTFASDEMFFQTIIGNASGVAVSVNDAVNFLEWDRPGLVLTSSDLASLAETHHMFARKFDIRIDGAVLDVIDAQLLDREGRSSP